jgi:hypothetical protein
MASSFAHLSSEAVAAQPWGTAVNASTVEYQLLYRMPRSTSLADVPVLEHLCKEDLGNSLRLDEKRSKCNAEQNCSVLNFAVLRTSECLTITMAVGFLRRRARRIPSLTLVLLHLVTRDYASLNSRRLPNHST